LLIIELDTASPGQLHQSFCRIPDLLT
jgi:hypothetical protein